MYLVNTRLDICFSMNTLSQHMVEPMSAHWIREKPVLRYIVGIANFGLDYIKGDGVSLVCYTDSDWAGCATDKKITSGRCFGLGSRLVSWFNQK
jgi:hypothetical protein